MFDRCRHTWEEVNRSHTPALPVTNIKQNGASDELFERILFGFTSIELKCSLCGDIQATYILGRVIR